MTARRPVDSLIRELAQMRGLSPDDAIRIAVSEALQRGHRRGKTAQEEATYSPSIEAIYARGLAMAGSRGEDKAVSQLCSDLGPAVVMFAVLLFGDAFFERHLQTTVIALATSIPVGWYLYWRNLENIRKSREQLRAALAVEIEELSQKFPDGLRFLADPPVGDPYFNVIMLEGRDRNS